LGRRAIQRRLVRSRIDGEQKVASANLVSFLIGHARHISADPGSDFD
jgi:hypothetical protein